MTNPAQETFVKQWNDVEMIDYERKIENGIVMNKSYIDWSLNGCKLVKVNGWH